MSEVLDRMLNEKYNEGKRYGKKVAERKMRAKYEESKKKGQITILAKLVQDKLLTIAQAAASADLSVPDFRSEAAAYGYRL